MPEGEPRWCTGDGAVRQVVEKTLLYGSAGEGSLQPGDLRPRSTAFSIVIWVYASAKKAQSTAPVREFRIAPNALDYP